MKVQTLSVATSSVALFSDTQNVRLKEYEISAVLSLASSKGNLIVRNAYAYWRCENSRFEESFYQNGFDCFNIPSFERNSADKKLIAHCRSQVLNNPAIETVILISGDRDFVPLVRALQAERKKVIVIARCNVSRKLINMADEFHYVNELCKHAA
ncbi:NYN domain-containing protein [Phormidesmis priestleyi]